tara:strand:- start:2584 stop:2826 length:243 start_codon:yes stop_codon:yes gene_type:complete
MAALELTPTVTLYLWFFSLLDTSPVCLRHTLIFFYLLLTKPKRAPVYEVSTSTLRDFNRLLADNVYHQGKEQYSPPPSPG